MGLPVFAESPVLKGGDECEKGIRRNLGEGGSASAGSAEDVKIPRVETRASSHLVRRIFIKIRFRQTSKLMIKNYDSGIFQLIIGKNYVFVVEPKFGHNFGVDA